MITPLYSIFSATCLRAPPVKSLWLRWWYQGPIGRGCSNAGSDERAECLCTSKPLGQAPVGTHQPEVIATGMVGGSGSGGWVIGMENRLWVMTIKIFLGGAEHGDEWRQTFTLDACFCLSGQRISFSFFLLYFTLFVALKCCQIVCIKSSKNCVLVTWALQ